MSSQPKRDTSVSTDKSEGSTIRVTHTTAKGDGYFEVTFEINGKQGRMMAQTSPKRFAYPE